MKILLLFLAIIFTGATCKKTERNNTKEKTSSIAFAKGADVGWLTEMEAAGIKFYNRNGMQQECMQILKELGMNSIRLRVWVNPVKGWNNTADVVAKAIRAKKLGMQVMIDFSL